MNKITLILGMALVTYLPRVTPFILKNTKKNESLDTFLKLIPYTALGALVIPGVFNAVSVKPLAGIIAALFAIFVAWKKENLVLTVVLSILVTYLILLI
jgi:branched-subunit amino acid transport protein